jgi:hypothetical protein
MLYRVTRTPWGPYIRVDNFLVRVVGRGIVLMNTPMISLSKPFCAKTFAKLLYPSQRAYAYSGAYTYTVETV